MQISKLRVHHLGLLAGFAASLVTASACSSDEANPAVGPGQKDAGGGTGGKGGAEASTGTGGSATHDAASDAPADAGGTPVKITVNAGDLEGTTDGHARRFLAI